MWFAGLYPSYIDKCSAWLRVWVCTVWKSSRKVEEESGRITESPKYYDMWPVCVSVMDNQLISQVLLNLEGG